jgi:pimeloyl-ACP methyl ester carboxylesterase
MGDQPATSRDPGADMDGVGRGTVPVPHRLVVRQEKGLTLHALEWRPALAAGATAGRTPDARSRAPFVLVHGLASNARTWDGVALELARRGHSAWAVDLRGHGGSDKPDEGYDVATVADDVCRLLALLAAGEDVDRPVLAGQSWGGNVVLEVAARCPDGVSGVVAVDGGTIRLADEYPVWPACAVALAPPRTAGTPAEAFERRLRARHPDWPESGIRGTLANMERRADGSVAPWLTRDRHMAILRGLWEHDPGMLYPRVAVPVLLAVARDGRREPARAARRELGVRAALERLPRADVAWFDGADHDIHAQRPVELADRMLAFAAGLPRA